MQAERGVDDRPAERQPGGDDVQEAPDGEARREREGCEREGHGSPTQPQRRARRSSTGGGGGAASGLGRLDAATVPPLELALERDEEVVAVRRGVGADLGLDVAASDEVDQRLLERLHLEELAVADRVGDLVGAGLADQVGDAGVRRPSPRPRRRGRRRRAAAAAARRRRAARRP